MVDRTWQVSEITSLADQPESSPSGLSSAEATRRATGDRSHHRHAQTLRLLIPQFANPLVLILIVGVALSLFLREWIDAAKGIGF